MTRYSLKELIYCHETYDRAEIRLSKRTSASDEIEGPL